LLLTCDNERLGVSSGVSKGGDDLYKAEGLLADRITKLAVMGAVAVAPFLLALAAYYRPGYFVSQTYLLGLLFLELVLAALWMYRQVFFPLVIMAFLLAGVSLPLSSFWVTGRWAILGAGAAAGTLLFLKDHSHRVGGFHALALFAVLAGLASAEVCRYTNFSRLKVLSLFLLFVYSATGARLAVTGRENRFFTGLLTGCEVFVAGLALLYAVGKTVMGNSNSLGAVMGVVCAPILLWGFLLQDAPFVRHRRLALFGVAVFLTFHSHARASITAAFLSCSLLCIGLRRNKLLAQGLCIVLILVATSKLVEPRAIPTFVGSLVYKGHEAGGVLSSRDSPWEGAVEIIRNHFWFGTGYGVTENGEDATPQLESFETKEGTTRENGSSYLTILTWVGMAGVGPFLLLLLVVLGKIVCTVRWMWNTRNPCHPAVPLAMVTFAGLIHACFEDWLFAAGYYLCVFFWCMAFILVDFCPIGTGSEFFGSPAGKADRSEDGFRADPIILSALRLH
jgi:O-antigen ligase